MNLNTLGKQKGTAKFIKCFGDLGPVVASKHELNDR